MLIAALTYCLTYLFFTGIIVMWGSVLHNRKERKQLEAKHGPFIELSNLTVLIPFRNEERRLGGLIESLNRSVDLPHHVIFINDHSDDWGAEYIHSALDIPNYQIINSTGNGKKQALRTGIAHVETGFILTHDADISFASDYFSTLKKYRPCDLLILPVRMVGKGWRTVFELDVHLTNALNKGISGYTNPIVSSGANLLFRTAAFEAFDRYDQHRHLESGDDQFLLRDFKVNNASIHLSTDPAVCVTTEAPHSLRAYFKQRLRWIGKAKAVNDTTATVLGATQVFFTFSFLVLLFISLYAHSYLLALVLVLVKTGIDVLVFAPFFMRLQRSSTLLLFPVYELVFPIYSIVLLLLLPVYHPRWKGRPIRHKKRDPFMNESP